jgi:type I restriction enzyme S subunit
MNSDVTVLPLEDCLDALIDYRGKTPVKTESGIPLITAKIIKGGRIEPPTEFIAKDEYVAWMRRGIPKAGDVVLTVEAPLGEVAQLGPERIALAQRVVTLRGKTGLLDSTYLLYLLQTEEMQAQLKSRATGTTVLGIKQSELRKVTLTLPSLDLQLSAAATLKTLDDRITLLRETNATLETIAQTVFKSWFVDFDPVHDKNAGRVPEGIDESTAALFPNNFEDSELGLLPKGWRVEPLTEVFDFKEGPGIRNWQYTNSDEGTKFINIRCIQDGDLSLATANRITDEEANGKYAHFHLQERDIVVSTSGTLGRSAIVRKEHLPLMLNTSVIRFRPIRPKMDFGYCFQYLNSPEFLYKLESMASGSVQKNFGPMHIKQIDFVCPPPELISRYESLSQPLIEKVIANRAQIATLADLRDTLLPRLISGQLRVNEIPE